MGIEFVDKKRSSSCHDFVTVLLRKVIPLLRKPAKQTLNYEENLTQLH